jgi:hypothetical protein
MSGEPSLSKFQFAEGKICRSFAVRSLQKARQTESLTMAALLPTRRLHQCQDVTKATRATGPIQAQPQEPGRKTESSTSHPSIDVWPDFNWPNNDRDSACSGGFRLSSCSSLPFPLRVA